jgi:hypothetical protein
VEFFLWHMINSGRKFTWAEFNLEWSCF